MNLRNSTIEITNLRSTATVTFRGGTMTLKPGSAAHFYLNRPSPNDLGFYDLFADVKITFERGHEPLERTINGFSGNAEELANFARPPEDDNTEGEGGSPRENGESGPNGRSGEALRVLIEAVANTHVSLANGGTNGHAVTNAATNGATSSGNALNGH